MNTSNHDSGNPGRKGTAQDGSPASGAGGNSSDRAQARPLSDPAWNDDIRAYYNAVVQEPLPQEFPALLAQIARAKPRR